MRQASTAHKSAILSLLRRCIRSVNKMPDPSTREGYRIYVRDGFYRNTQLIPDSREALSAYRDAVDQVEQMEYYHSLVQQKRNEEKQKASGISASVQSIHANNVLASNQYASTTKKDIEEWLLQHLPHLSKDDLIQYSQKLVDDGFDSVPFLELELLADDILFMKKAHRRVIERYLNNKADGSNAEK